MTENPMILRENIEVIAYAGYREEESPRAFFLDGRWIEVVKIVDQWIEETADGRERLRCYRVKGNDWKSHVICYDEEKREWIRRISPLLHERQGQGQKTKGGKKIR